MSGKRDSTAPAAFLAFMMSKWRPRPVIKPSPVASFRAHAERRRKLAAAFPGEILVIPAGREKLRNADTPYRFRPNSNFFYLTGCADPESVLVLIPRRGRPHEHRLYVAPNNGRKDSSFFTDRSKGELWVGPRLGVKDSRARFRVERCVGLTELESFLARARKLRQKVRILRGVDEVVERKVRSRAGADRELLTKLAEFRLIKDPCEVRAIVRAAAATKEALAAVIEALPTAKGERELEAAFDAKARVRGAGVGYGTIVAAGAHACVLHWTRNDGRLARKKLVLIDAGVETEELYTADVTRTLPVSGRFGRAERELYDLVLEAHAAALAAIKPGEDFSAPHRAASRVLAAGIIKLGVLKMTLDEAMDPQKLFYRRYTLHGTCHLLGLDVHDGEGLPPSFYREGKLAAGMVLTVEPGLYFQVDDLTVPPRYRGIGIRVEDDVVVTKSGCRVLTFSIPRGAGEIEAWMRELWAKTRA